MSGDNESMLERVARAIEPDEWIERPDSWDLRRASLAKARAAIEAMREPTEAMVSATYDVAGPGDEGGTERGDFISEWTAAIDAALSPAEKPAKPPR